MGLLKKISDLFAPSQRRPAGRDDSAYRVYVRCNRCGEALPTRINLNNDLSINYGEGEADTTYFCRKVMIGSGLCFQRVEVELTFDRNRKLLEREITGGEFITEQAYQEGAPESPDDRD